MRKNFLTVLALTGALFTGALAGCDGNNPDGPGMVQTPTLTDTSVTLSVGGTKAIAVNNASGDVVWSTTNSNVATVDDGVITAVGAGSAIIKATVDGKTLNCSITVTASFTITYNANGGTGTVVDQNTYNGTTYATFAVNGFTAPSGKDFLCWNTKADGTGENIVPGSQKLITSDMTLYARWIDHTGPVLQEHTINVSTPEGVVAALSKTSAEKNEQITLTISLTGSLILDGNPTSAQTTITKVAGQTNTFKFIMPDESVWINIKVTIDGDIITTGDLAVELTDEGSGIFAARNVTAAATKSEYAFAVSVKDSGSGSVKKLAWANLDETKCNAMVSPYTSDKTLSYVVPGGYTYDLVYDSNAGAKSFYIVRNTVLALPSNETTLSNLFDVKAVGYKNTMFPNLTSVHYEKKTDGTNSEVGLSAVDTTYDYKKISATRSFAKAVDNKSNATSYVYKDIDLSANVYSVVNTYMKTKLASSKIEGNNENDDFIWTLNPYGGKEGSAYYKPFSAKLDVIADTTNNHSRNEVTISEAKRNVSVGAHTIRELEYEIWESYRGDFSGAAIINAANAAGSHCNISTVTTGMSGFKTTVESQLEYNHVESGSTADVTQQYATTYNVEFRFFNNGNLYSVDYTSKFYDKNKWDFTNHCPLASVTPITTTIKVTNTYNSLNDNDTTLGSFDPSIYFVSSIDNLTFYNANTKATKDGVNSFLSFNDEIEIYPYGNGGDKSSLVDTCTFSPATALDMWQYGVSAAGDATIIGKNPQGRACTVGLGETTMTISNRTANSSTVSKTIPVFVTASGTFNSLFFNTLVKGYDSYQCENANIAVAYAGKTMSYYVEGSTNTGAPAIYYLIFETKNKLGQVQNKGTTPYFNVVGSNVTTIQITDEDLGMNDVTCYKVSGNVLTIDCNTEAANSLTGPVSVSAYFMSDYYKDGFGPTKNTFTIYPAQQSVVNTSWSVNYYYTVSASDSTLTDDIYDTATISFETGGTGKIIDQYYNKAGQPTYLNTYNFTYTERNNGKIDVHLTSVDLKDPAVASETVLSNYLFEVEMSLSTGGLGVGLIYNDAAAGDYDVIFGAEGIEDDSVIIDGLTLFSKVVD